MRNNLTAQNLCLYVWNRNLVVPHEASSITSNCCLNDTLLIYYAGKLYMVTYKESSSCGLLTSQCQCSNWYESLVTLTRRYQMKLSNKQDDYAINAYYLILSKFYQSRAKSKEEIIAKLMLLREQLEQDYSLNEDYQSLIDTAIQGIINLEVK